MQNIFFHRNIELIKKTIYDTIEAAPFAFISPEGCVGCCVFPPNFFPSFWRKIVPNNANTKCIHHSSHLVISTSQRPPSGAREGWTVHEYATPVQPCSRTLFGEHYTTLPPTRSSAGEAYASGCVPRRYPVIYSVDKRSNTVYWADGIMHLHGELNHVYRGECAMFRPGPDNPMVPAGDVADGVWCMSVRTCARVCVCVWPNGKRTKSITTSVRRWRWITGWARVGSFNCVSILSRPFS